MRPRRQRVRRRSPDPEGEVDIDPERHECLQFRQATMELRYQSLATKRINDAHHLTWNPMVALNISDWMEERIPTQWRRLLETHHSQYTELVLEFYTTYDVATEITDVEAETITFRMRGVSYSLSLSEFATRMGIYTVEELPERIGKKVYQADAEKVHLWQQLTGLTMYDSSTYKASNIRDPRIRVLHRIISTAFYGRTESVGNVTHGDLNVLNAMLSGQFLCPARYLADELLKLSGRQSNQAISGGAFITRLARGLNVRLDGLTEVARNLGITLQSLKNCRLAGSHRGRPYLLTKEGHEWFEELGGIGLDDISFTPPDIPTAPPEFQAGPSGSSSHAGPSTEPYFPPQSFYDGLTSQLAQMEITQTNHWDYSHRRAETDDQRWGRLETQQTELWDYAHQQAAIQEQRWEDHQQSHTELWDYSHQRADIDDQRWGATQQHFQQESEFWTRQADQWNQQAEFYRKQEEAWARFAGPPPAAPRQPSPDTEVDDD